MKKLITLVLALFLMVGVAGLQSEVLAQEEMPGDFIVKVGADKGSFDMDMFWVNESVDSEVGISFVGEYIYPFQDNISIGGGLEYQLERKSAESDSDDGMSFMPIYGLIRMTPEEQDNLYLVGKLGYNTFNADIEDSVDYSYDYNGGMYYGIGAGVKIRENIEAEVLYSKSNGEIEVSDNYGNSETADVGFSRVGLFIGTSF